MYTGFAPRGATSVNAFGLFSRLIGLGQRNSRYEIRTLKSQRDQPVWLPKQPSPIALHGEICKFGETL